MKKRLHPPELRVTKKIHSCITKKKETLVTTCVSLLFFIGHRHILVNKSLWMAEVAEILKSEFQQHGYNVSTVTLPQFVFSVVALFDKEAKEVKGMLNKTFEYDNTRVSLTMIS